jgi:hypothetical protein
VEEVAFASTENKSELAKNARDPLSALMMEDKNHAARNAVQIIFVHTTN